VALYQVLQHRLISNFPLHRWCGPLSGVDASLGDDVPAAQWAGFHHGQASLGKATAGTAAEQHCLVETHHWSSLLRLVPFWLALKTCAAAGIGPTLSASARRLPFVSYSSAQPQPTTADQRVL
jgi:hypothetical protein